jgi:hypothetical protein
MFDPRHRRFGRSAQACPRGRNVVDIVRSFQVRLRLADEDVLAVDGGARVIAASLTARV